MSKSSPSSSRRKPNPVAKPRAQSVLSKMDSGFRRNDGMERARSARIKQSGASSASFSIAARAGIQLLSLARNPFSAKMDSGFRRNDGMERTRSARIKQSGASSASFSIAARAGIQLLSLARNPFSAKWIPAFAGIRAWRGLALHASNRALSSSTSVSAIRKNNARTAIAFVAQRFYDTGDLGDFAAVEPRARQRQSGVARDARERLAAAEAQQETFPRRQRFLDVAQAIVGAEIRALRGRGGGFLQPPILSTSPRSCACSPLHTRPARWRRFLPGLLARGGDVADEIVDSPCRSAPGSSRRLADRADGGGSSAPASGVVPTPSVCTPILASVFGIVKNRPKMPIDPVIVVGCA